MKNSIASLKNKLRTVEGQEDRSGYYSIKGGSNVLFVITNNQCTNGERVCSGTNNVCTNKNDCSKGTNVATYSCSNASCNA